ncbi:uncharacterized protein EV422DRAFT_97827 [Fimicolochytrium jonesii]|uniref:uncharacterized protein n=1 Tax=Fimicolochytrium jonesii TaxID=1396493 RepID=UPI0022FE3D7C|nr:uncharacterized protein EV422DRAFT_97827 [Fimicolochytrium jonesii]KAI8819582.1 hypothetical protein EV422DRAFT_97827 [Fimicolochytrium jonesii]
MTTHTPHTRTKGHRNAPVASAPAKLCAVCKVEPFKYKCPTCKAPYCSLVCYKTHRETPCAPSSPTPELSTPATTTAAKSNINVEDDETKLSDEQLAGLEHSDHVRMLVTSTELQRILTELDGTQNPQKAYEAALQNSEVFREFVDRALEAVGRAPEGVDGAP